MDTKSKILFWTLLVLVVLSVSASYYKFVVLQDYLVEAEVDCDPSLESCFIWVCDPEIDGEEYCTGNPEEDTWYYKFAYRNAMNVINCDIEDEECLPFACPEEGEDQCEEVFCDADTLLEYGFEEGAVCTNPIDFADWLLEEEEELEEDFSDENFNEIEEVGTDEVTVDTEFSPEGDSVVDESTITGENP